MSISAKKIIRNVVNLTGYDIRKIRHRHFSAQYGEDQFFNTHGLTRIQYACGPKLLRGWVNVDFYSPAAMKEKYGMTAEFTYYQADLSLRQPFQDSTFLFAYAEDFIEHLDQADSLIFLFECYRVLAADGVLRLSFPGLEGVLKRHFSSPLMTDLVQGRKDAYEHYDHRHFYSREEISLAARHIGFSDIRFTAYGESDHAELNGLETRDGQQDLNIYIELTK